MLCACVGASVVIHVDEDNRPKRICMMELVVVLFRFVFLLLLVILLLLLFLKLQEQGKRKGEKKWGVVSLPNNEESTRLSSSASMSSVVPPLNRRWRELSILTTICIRIQMCVHKQGDQQRIQTTCPCLCLWSTSKRSKDGWSRVIPVERDGGSLIIFEDTGSETSWKYYHNTLRR